MTVITKGMTNMLLIEPNADDRGGRGWQIVSVKRLIRDGAHAVRYRGDEYEIVEQVRPYGCPNKTLLAVMAPKELSGQPHNLAYWQVRGKKYQGPLLVARHFRRNLYPPVPNFARQLDPGSAISAVHGWLQSGETVEKWRDIYTCMEHEVSASAQQFDLNECDSLNDD